MLRELDVKQKELLSAEAEVKALSMRVMKLEESPLLLFCLFFKKRSRRRGEPPAVVLSFF